MATKNESGQQTRDYAYPDKIKETAVKLMRSGMTRAQVCELMGCAPQTLSRWMKEANENFDNENDIADILELKLVELVKSRMDAVLSSITEDDIKNARLVDKTRAGYILFQMQQVLQSRPASIAQTQAQLTEFQRKVSDALAEQNENVEDRIASIAQEMQGEDGQ